MYSSVGVEVTCPRLRFVMCNLGFWFRRDGRMVGLLDRKHFCESTLFLLFSRFSSGRKCCLALRSGRVAVLWSSDLYRRDSHTPLLLFHGNIGEVLVRISRSLQVGRFTRGDTRRGIGSFVVSTKRSRSVVDREGFEALEYRLNRVGGFGSGEGRRRVGCSFGEGRREHGSGSGTSFVHVYPCLL